MPEFASLQEEAEFLRERNRGMTKEEIESSRAKQKALVTELQARIKSLEADLAKANNDSGAALSDLAKQHKAEKAALAKQANDEIAARDATIGELNARCEGLLTKMEQQADHFVGGVKTLLGGFDHHPEVKAAKVARLKAKAEAAAKEAEEAGA